VSDLVHRLRDAYQARMECFDSEGLPIEIAFRNLGFNASHLFGEAADILEHLLRSNDAMKEQIDRLRAENDTLRLIAIKVMPCHYCGAESLAKCPHGFPGCSLADDALCGEEPMAAEIQKLRAALTRITHLTSATPSLSVSDCGRMLAQIERVADAAMRGEK
jgi:hypothetical protein